MRPRWKRRPGQSRYSLTLTKKSTCPKCHLTVHYLYSDADDAHGSHSAPEFFICFGCQKVFHVGVGEVTALTEVSNAM